MKPNKPDAKVYAAIECMDLQDLIDVFMLYGEPYDADDLDGMRWIARKNYDKGLFQAIDFCE